MNVFVQHTRASWTHAHSFNDSTRLNSVARTHIIFPRSRAIIVFPLWCPAGWRTGGFYRAISLWFPFVCFIRTYWCVCGSHCTSRVTALIYQDGGGQCTCLIWAIAGCNIDVVWFIIIRTCESFV